MNDYALHQARFSGNLAGGGLLTRLIANWQARRGVASLSALDDHMLRDIGVLRADVERLKHLPLGNNAVHALEELARLRRWGVCDWDRSETHYGQPFEARKSSHLRGHEFFDVCG